jgi:Tol biopolymer transport system component
VAVVTLAIGLPAGRLLAPRPAPPQVARLALMLPQGQRMSAGPVPILGVSPDGSAIAYVVDQAGAQRLFIRPLDDTQPREVATSGSVCCPQFSADGQWLYFLTSSGSAMLKAPVSGGTPVNVPIPPGTLAGVAWASPVVLTLGGGQLAHLRPDGSVDTVAAPDSVAGRVLQAVDVLPDGRILAILGYQGPLVAVSSRTGKRDTLVNALVTGAFHDRGYIAWVEQSGVAFGARLGRGGRRIAGQPVQLATGVRITPGGFPAFAASRSGVLVFIGAQPAELMLVDRAGRSRPLTAERRRFHSPRVSPDGRLIAVDVTEASTRDVWLLDRRDSTFTRFSFEHWGHDPMWTADGGSVVFAADVGGAAGVFRRNADGSGAADSVLVQGEQLTAHSPGAPGHVLAVRIGGSGQDIVSVPLAGERRTATPVLATPYVEAYPALSPDGRWLAYVSDESGRNEVYVRPFPGPGPRTIISQNGGSEPAWARGGRELFYKAVSGHATLMAAALELRSEPRVVARRPLFAIDDYEDAAPHANYDVLPDGSGFVMVRQGRAAELNVIQHWPEIVRRQLAGGPR